jgi:hypothetical protein
MQKASKLQITIIEQIQLILEISLKVTPSDYFLAVSDAEFE